MLRPVPRTLSPDVSSHGRAPTLTKTPASYSWLVARSSLMWRSRRLSAAGENAAHFVEQLPTRSGVLAECTNSVPSLHEWR